MQFFLDIAYSLAGLALLPMVLYRALFHGRYRSGWAQRFGRIDRPHSTRPCIWIHAVSMGEVNAARTLVQALADRFNDHDLLITTTTDTGFARAQALFGNDHQISYYPFDISWINKRAFNHIQPSLCLLMELEVWPHFVKTATERNIPVVVINGRISDNSFKTYRRVRPLLAPTFKRLQHVLAQTEEYAQRFVALGCPADRVEVTGSLKYDTAHIGDTAPGADELAQRLNLNSQPLWVAGGTGPQEEALILSCYQALLRDIPDLRLTIVPRKPERFDGVAQLIEQTGLSVARYSQIKGTEQKVTDPQAVILGDTMGDLRAFFSLATVAFVGRSLVPMGGSDMIEVVALAKPTLFGPHTFNFKQTVDALLKAEGAWEVPDAEALTEAVRKCLLEPDVAQTLGQRGQAVIKAHQGTTQKTLEVVEKLLKG